MNSTSLPAVPKGVHRVVRRNDGSVKAVYYYWRATGDKLPDDPLSPDFANAIAELKSPGKRAGTIGALIIEYRRSPGFQRLKPNTKRAYERALGKIGVWDEFPIKDLTRGHAKRLQEKLAATPGIANQVVDVLAILLQYAVEMDYIQFNIASRIKRLPGGQYSRWPDDAIDYALEYLPEPFRRAMVLALYTGQRAGDCIAMRWSDYDGSAIRVTQEKTGAKLWIPCHATLRRELEQWRAEAASTILTNTIGKPWLASSFYTVFSKTTHARYEDGTPKHRPLAGLVFHGLRKTAAAKLAEAGCTVHEIAAITGHKTLEMIQHYTVEAEQKSRAIAAIHKLENRR